MHPVGQYSLDVSHRVANVQSRREQPAYIVFRQAGLLRCLLQSFYRKEDGYPGLILHDSTPPLLVCIDLVSQRPASV